MIKTYLFDLDDTLIDTKIYASLYNSLLTKIKRKLDLNSKQLDTKAARLGLKKNKFGRWDTGDLCKELELLDLYYEELERAIHIKPVLHNKIEKLFSTLKKRKKTIGIVSNSMKRTINLFLNKYNLTKYITHIFSGDKYKKSDNMFWQKVIEKVNPSECLIIGDDLEQDVIKPRQFGFKTLHLNKTFSKPLYST